MKQKAVYVLPEVALYWQVIHSEVFDVLLKFSHWHMWIWILEILPLGCGDIHVKYYAKYGILLPNDANIIINLVAALAHLQWVGVFLFLFLFPFLIEIILT